MASARGITLFSSENSILFHAQKHGKNATAQCRPVRLKQHAFPRSMRNSVTGGRSEYISRQTSAATILRKIWRVGQATSAL